MNFNKTSLANLKGVHPDLVKVALRAKELCPVDFILTDGLRSVAEQIVLVRKGLSKTMASRHLKQKCGYSCAVDFVQVVNGKAMWDAKYFRPGALAFKQAAKELNIPIEWGGDWKSFQDCPHIQLPHKQYP